MSVEIPAGQVLRDYFEDHGLRDGRRKSPWQIPPTSRRVLEAPVTYWIYNVSPRRIALSPLPGNGKYLVGAKSGQEYGKPYPIKEVTLDYAAGGDYKLHPFEVDAEDYIPALLYPTPGDSTDLRQYGVFASKHNPPLKVELDAANAKLKETYFRLVKRADDLWENPKNRHEVNASPCYAEAAKALGITNRDWCKAFVQTTPCPACAGPLLPESVRCDKSSCGAILDWKKARRFGMVSKEQYDEAVEEGWVE